MSEPQSSVKQLANTILHVNRAYQETLSEKIENLQKRLKYNLYCQAQLNKKISESSAALSAAKISNFNTTKEVTPFAQNEQELNKIKYSYFKDRFGSEPPENADTLRIRKLHFYGFLPTNSNEWTLTCRKKLKQSVLKDCLKQLKTPHLNKINFLTEKFNKLKVDRDAEYENYEQYVSVKRLLKQARLSMTKIESLTEAQVLSECDVEKVDWMKISKIDLNDNFSATGIRDSNILCLIFWIT